jgi:type VI secretion system protein ImpL
VLPVLNELRELPAGYASREAEVPWSQRFGLYQGDGIGERSIAAYRRALGEVLLTRASLRLEEILAGSRELEQIYVGLRGYVMLHQDKYLEPAGLAGLMLSAWSGALPREGAVEAAAQLDGHLKAALEAKPLQLIAARNDALIAESRRKLASLPVADRVYARLKMELSGDATVAPWRPSEHAGPNAAQVLTRGSGQPLGAGIDGLFTKEGYNKLFKQKGEALAKELSKEESWVLGDADARAQKADAAKVWLAVRERYAQDYARQWEALLGDIRVLPSSSLPHTIEQAKLLSAPDSPLKRLLQSAAKELSLTSLEDAAKQQAAKEAEKKLGASTYGKLFQGQGAKLAGPIPEDAVDGRFAPLRNFVLPNPAGVAPIDSAMQSLNEILLQLKLADEALREGKASPALAGAGAKLRSDADRYPEPLRAVLRELGQTASAQASGATQANLKSQLLGSAGFCNKAIAGKYPFAARPQGEVLLDDFNKVFSPGGEFDVFFKEKLAQFVDAPPAGDWRARPGMEKSVSPATIRQYQRAALIRETFFKPGSQQAQVTVDVKLLALTGAAELTVEHDGRASKMAQGSVVRLEWPTKTPGAGTKISIAGAAAIAGEGPWALFRVLDRGAPQPGAQPGFVRLAFAPDAAHRAVLELQPTSVNNPFHSRALKDFECPK